MQFTPSLSEVAGPAVSVVGNWTTPFTLVLTFDNVSSAPYGTAASGVDVGVWTVGVLPSAQLKSFNSQSNSSNATAVLSLGSWGIVPVVELADKSSTSLRIQLSPPSQPWLHTFRISRYLVQWSVTPTFAALSTPTSWATALATAANVSARSNSSSAGLTLSASGGPASSSGTNVVTAYPVDVATPSGGSVVLSLPPSAPSEAVVYFVEGLTPGVPLFARAACDNAGTDLVGDLATSTPASLAPQPPQVTSVVTPSGPLSGSGGQTITLLGTRLGQRGVDVVTLVLANGVYAFASPSCAVSVDFTAVACVSPLGVGGGFVPLVTVGNVSSAVAAGVVVSYAPPLVLAMTASGEQVSQGGFVVVVSGRNFGPAALGSTAVNRVTATPEGLPWTFTPACSVVADDTTLRCVVPSGVGGGLQWTCTWLAVGGGGGTASCCVRAPFWGRGVDVWMFGCVWVRGCVCGREKEGKRKEKQNVVECRRALPFRGARRRMYGGRADRAAVLSYCCAGASPCETAAITCCASADSAVLACVVCPCPLLFSCPRPAAVVIGNQTTAPARTTYRAPTVAGLAVVLAPGGTPVNDSVSLVSLPSSGGAVVVLYGDYFGGADVPVPRVLSGVGVGGGGARVTVQTSACTVTTDHVVLSCVLPLGVGSSYTWKVRHCPARVCVSNVVCPVRAAVHVGGWLLRRSGRCGVVRVIFHAHAPTHKCEHTHPHLRGAIRTRAYHGLASHGRSRGFKNTFLHLSSPDDCLAGSAQVLGTGSSVLVLVGVDGYVWTVG